MFIELIINIFLETYKEVIKDGPWATYKKVIGDGVIKVWDYINNEPLKTRFDNLKTLIKSDLSFIIYFRAIYNALLTS